MNNNRKRTIEIEYEMKSIDKFSTIKRHRFYNDDGTFETIISEAIDEKRLSRKEKREAYLKNNGNWTKTDDYIEQYGREQKFKWQLCISDVEYKDDKALEKHLKKDHDARITVEKYVETMLSKLMVMKIWKISNVYLYNAK